MYARTQNSFAAETILVDTNELIIGDLASHSIVVADIISRTDIKQVPARSIVPATDSEWRHSAGGVGHLTKDLTLITYIQRGAFIRTSHCLDERVQEKAGFRHIPRSHCLSSVPPVPPVPPLPPRLQV